MRKNRKEAKTGGGRGGGEEEEGVGQKMNKLISISVKQWDQWCINKGRSQPERQKYTQEKVNKTTTKTKNKKQKRQNPINN